jgi:cysteine synthase A
MIKIFIHAHSATGIGQGRITDNLATFVKELSGAFTVPDSKSIAMLYELLDTEGLYVGATSALNVVAAVELAEKLGKGADIPAMSVCQQFDSSSQIGSTVVTILCDGAHRYQSRIFSKQWIQKKGLEAAIPPHLRKYMVLD